MIPKRPRGFSGLAHDRWGKGTDGFRRRGGGLAKASSLERAGAFYEVLEGADGFATDEGVIDGLGAHGERPMDSY